MTKRRVPLSYASEEQRKRGGTHRRPAVTDVSVTGHSGPLDEDQLSPRLASSRYQWVRAIPLENARDLYRHPPRGSADGRRRLPVDDLDLELSAAPKLGPDSATATQSTYRTDELGEIHVHPPKNRPITTEGQEYLAGRHSPFGIRQIEALSHDVDPQLRRHGRRSAAIPFLSWEARTSLRPVLSFHAI